MIAVRREDAKHWPCPWIMPDLSGCSSRPERWTLGAAIKDVKERRRSDNPLAVYDVRGVTQRKIYPR